MRAVNIRAMLLEIAIEKLYDVMQRDLPQPEVVRREERQRFEPPIITEALDHRRAEALLPCLNVFATIENDLQSQKVQSLTTQEAALKIRSRKVIITLASG